MIRQAILASSILLTGALLSTTTGCQATKTTEPTQVASLADLVNEQAGVRSEARTARDAYRNPIATLTFFEVAPTDTIVEIWPGGGWYTDILAPLVKTDGKLIAAHFASDSGIPYFTRSLAKYQENYLSKPEVYGDIELTELYPPKKLMLATEGSADKVLTFRNVHNWMRNDQVLAVFEASFKALKPGGILGVVEHRAPESFSIEKMIKSGYVSESYVIDMATKAGFELIGSSDINNNALDTHEHPNGVWSLPPSLRGGEENKDAFLKIGESDRMTLKFQKPE